MTPQESGPTGPRTAAGKARSSQNAVTLGLFTLGDFVRPEEQAEYDAICEALKADLSPEGALEQNFAAEIIGATWRLRRCSRIESGLSDRFLLDPMLCEDEQSVRIQTAIDRARSHAHNVLRRSMGELRRLQTERILRDEVFLNQPVPEEIGLTDYHQILKALVVNERGDLLAQRVEQGKLAAALSPVPPSSFCKPAPAAPPQTPQTPRNALCPCGSGVKYKRCCGKHSPPVLQKAA